MIVLDTTVLVYAVGAESEFRQPCRLLVQAVGDGRLEATTTVEAVQEFAHVRARRRGRADAARLARSYLELLEPLLEVSAAALRDGLVLFEQHEVLGAFDAVLAAAAVRSGSTALVSADSGFAVVEHLRHVRPDDAGVRGLLPDG